MLRFVLGLVIGVLLIPLFGFLYFRFGYAPVATASSPMPFEKQMAHMALNARIEKEAPKNSPVQPTEEAYEAGAHIYRSNCAMCHGLPGKTESPTSKGMFPVPPQLFKGHGVTDDPAGETYWKVAYGIRLTGMPAYKESLSDTEMWQVSLMLANYDKVAQPVHSILEQP